MGEGGDCEMKLDFDRHFFTCGNNLGRKIDYDFKLLDHSNLISFSYLQKFSYFPICTTSELLQIYDV